MAAFWAAREAEERRVEDEKRQQIRNADRETLRKLVDSCKDQLLDIRSKSAFASNFPYYSPPELEKFAGMGTALNMPLGGFPRLSTTTISMQPRGTWTASATRNTRSRPSHSLSKERRMVSLFGNMQPSSVASWTASRPTSRNGRKSTISTRGEHLSKSPGPLRFRRPGISCARACEHKAAAWRHGITGRVTKNQHRLATRKC